MIVNTGKIALLNLQLTALAAYEWRLFDSNTTITDATVFADLTEASFTGYAPVTVGTLGTASLVGSRAQTLPVVQPSWTNSGGSPTDFYVWGLVDPAGPTLVSATNIGLTTIPAGLTWALNVGITDTQE